jgi:hypothetical protein
MKKAWCFGISVVCTGLSQSMSTHVPDNGRGKVQKNSNLAGMRHSSSFMIFSQQATEMMCDRMLDLGNLSIKQLPEYFAAAAFMNSLSHFVKTTE